MERFAALAAETDRPLVLHAVYEDALKAAAILRKYGVKRAHFHWYKGDEETTRLLAESGYWISITPDVVYEPDIRQLAATYPLGQLMTETDGPWPFQGPFAGSPTRTVDDERIDSPHRGAQRHGGPGDGPYIGGQREAILWIDVT